MTQRIYPDSIMSRDEAINLWDQQHGGLQNAVMYNREKYILQNGAWRTYGAGSRHLSELMNRTRTFTSDGSTSCYGVRVAWPALRVDGWTLGQSYTKTLNVLLRKQRASQQLTKRLRN